MGSRLSAARDAARRSLPGALTDLEDFVRIRSVSGDRAHQGDVDAAAGWVHRRLRRLSAQLVIARSRARPVAVIARVAGRRPAGSEPTDRPVVVLYGHLDVKPPGSGWTGPPFSPERRDGQLWGRGTSDDKGPLLALIVAVEAWHSQGGAPCDTILIADCGEEIGSPGLLEALRALRGQPILRGAVHAVLICDTRVVSRGRPSLTVSQRGLLDARVTVTTKGAPHHAGRYGGAVPDPSLVLATMLTAAAGVATGRSVSALGTVDEPALTVTSLQAGGTPGAIPVTAEADLDIRIPPRVSPATTRTAVEAAIAKTRPAGVTARVEWRRLVAGIRYRPPAAAARALDAACRAGFGVETVAVASGASIPAAAVLGSVFGVDPLLLGICPAEDGAHGPDEHLDLRDWARAVDTSVVFLDTLVHSLANTDAPSAGSRAGTDLVAPRFRPRHLSAATSAPSDDIFRAPVMNRGFTVDTW